MTIHESQDTRPHADATPMTQPRGLSLRSTLAGVAIGLLLVGCSSDAPDTLPFEEPTPGALQTGETETAPNDPGPEVPAAELDDPQLVDPAIDGDEPFDFGIDEEIIVDDPLLTACSSAVFGDEAPIGLLTADELREWASTAEVDQQILLEDCLASG